MGWKNVKEYYRIGHMVQVTDEGICIGSPFIHDIIVITSTGRFKKYYYGGNVDLRRYQDQMDADLNTLKRLIETEDTFANSITVYTYCDGEVLEKQCEALGWPNVTHDGRVMYENTFSTDRAQAAEWAKEDCRKYLKHYTEQIVAATGKIDDWTAYARVLDQRLQKLIEAYPDQTLPDLVATDADQRQREYWEGKA